MNCPEHLVFKSRFVWIWMYWRDVPRDSIPLRIWMNPLRYEINMRAAGRRVVMNREGMIAGRTAYRLRKAWCKVSGHKPRVHRPGSTFVFCARCYKPLPEALAPGCGDGVGNG